MDSGCVVFIKFSNFVCVCVFLLEMYLCRMGLHRGVPAMFFFVYPYTEPLDEPLRICVGSKNLLVGS